jgi:HAMP domain-containing protein
MSLIGIVAISVLAALFLFTLLAGLAVLIWLAMRLRKDLTAAQQQAAAVYAETQKLLQSHQAESRTSIESAKSSFGAIRNEVKTSLEGQQGAWKAATETQTKELRATLDQFKADIGVAISKINADALQTVAVRLTNVSIRAEKAISVFQELILSAGNPGPSDLPDEAFAPEESQFAGPPSAYSVSPTARMDQEADMVEQASQLTESLAEV